MLAYQSIIRLGAFIAVFIPRKLDRYLRLVQDAGFEQVSVLRGGMESWSQSSYAAERQTQVAGSTPTNGAQAGGTV